MTWTYFINDLNEEEIVGTLYKKELKKKKKKKNNKTNAKQMKKSIELKK